MSDAPRLAAAPVPDDDDNVRRPLAHLHGARPPAPAWFEAALAQCPERTVVAAGVEIELLTWGERGRPGLLFIHGGMAHADWWSFVAPFFAADHRVAALSLSGMGGTGWRERYGMDVYMDEALAAAEAAGLFDAGPPVVIGHSFGGGVTTYLARHAGERLRAAVVVDAGVRPPAKRWRGPPRSDNRPDRVHPDFDAALARFRLAPSQPCSQLHILDHIGRASLREVEGGWRWRFDPHLWDRMEHEGRGSQEEELAGVRCPIAFVWGEQSRIMEPDVVAYTREHAPPGTPMFAIPDAGHHVMLDQPLALVSALRGLFSAWPR